MKGQYTKFEWEFVRAGSGENDQLSRFYRCWVGIFSAKSDLLILFNDIILTLFSILI